MTEQTVTNLQATYMFERPITILSKGTLICLLPLLLIGCNSDTSKINRISKDLQSYEGLPKWAADCIARDFVQSASDEAVNRRIALIEGDISDIPSGAGDWGGAPFNPELALEGCGQADDVGTSPATDGTSTPMALTASEIVGTEQHPLPKPGYWQGTEKTLTQWVAFNGQDEVEENEIETCLVGDWEISLNNDPSCKNTFSRKGNGVIEFSSDCPLPPGGRTLTNTRTEYSRESSNTTIVSEIFEPGTKASGPVAQMTVRINQAWIGTQCPDRLLTGR